MNQDKNDLVYLLRCDNFHYYKIGWCVTTRKNPLLQASRRISQLQVGNPFPLILIDHALIPYNMGELFENELHKRYESRKLRGEWFRLDDLMIRELRDILKRNDIRRQLMVS